MRLLPKKMMDLRVSAGEGFAGAAPVAAVVSVFGDVVLVLLWQLASIMMIGQMA